MALRGNLKELSLPDIFQLVTFSGKTGVLRIVREDGAAGSVWFRDGEVFFAQSNWRTEPLGQRLVRAQRITPMALDRALELRKAEGPGGRRLGEILIENGYITAKVLETFVQEQMQDTIFDLMRWDEGEFEFEAMPEAPEEDIGLAVSIENIIMEGSRRLEEWNRIKKKIPSTDIVFKMATAPGEGTFEISLKPIEWNLLLLVDGTRSVAELALETSRTDFEVARIVYGLFSAGLLEFAADDEVARLRAERVDRETKLAAIEAERTAALDAAQVAAKAAEPTAPVVPSAPTEVPEFLGGGQEAPTAEDMVVLEEMMGAVLEQRPAQAEPAPGSSEATPYVPAEEPAFISASQVEEGERLVPVPSVEELLADLAEKEPQVASVEAASAAVAEAATAQLASETAEVAAPVAAPREVTAPQPAPTAPPEQVAPQTTPPAAPAEKAAPAPEAEQPVARPEPPSQPVVAEEPIPQPAPAKPAAKPQAHVDLAAEVVAPPQERVELPTEAATVPPAPAPAAATLAAETEVVAPEVAPQPPAVRPEELAGPQQAAPAAPAPSAIPGLGSFEHDLMALGLGELPAELRSQEAPEQAAPLSGAVPAPAAPESFEFSPEDFDVEFAPPVEPMGVVATPGPTPAPAQHVPPAAELDALAASLSDMGEAPPATAPQAEETVDFSALLESLDVSADDAHGAPAGAENAEPQFDANLLLESAPAPGGIISTDAFLEDITLDEGFGYSGELTDELSALTGADRPTRPSASVKKILEPDAEGLLRRDARVDRETLLKIIDGIKNL